MTTRLRVTLTDPDYEIVESGIHFELIYHEPALRTWVSLAERGSIKECLWAYERVQNGEPLGEE